jgi:hypothetical protein
MLVLEVPKTLEVLRVLWVTIRVLVVRCLLLVELR